MLGRATKQSVVYFPQLDCLRFFAFVCVFFFHVLPSNDVNSHTGLARTLAIVESTVRISGQSGVALFFLLSAFLITELLGREKKSQGGVHLAWFYVRRALRIWPLYYFAVCIGLAISLASPQFALSTADLLAYLFFWKNWDVAFHGFNWNPIYILWSVSAEEQFYLVWPFLQKHLPRNHLLVLCIASGLLMLAVPFSHPFAAWSEMAFDFVYFAAGALISLVLNGSRYQRSRLACSGLFAAGAVFWLGGTYLVKVAMPLSSSRFAVGDVAILLGTVLLFLAFYLSDPAWCTKPLLYLGKISYGLYVYHVMMISIAAWLAGLALKTSRIKVPPVILRVGVIAPVAFILTIIVAALSYEWLEKRFLRLKDRFALIATRAA